MEVEARDGKPTDRRRVDVGDRGLKDIVDLQTPAFFSGKSDGIQIEPVRVRLPADGVQQGFGHQGLAALELCAGCARRVGADGRNRLAEEKGDAVPAQMVHERLRDLMIDVVDQHLLGFDEGDFAAQRRRHRRVLEPITPPPTTITVLGNSPSVTWMNSSES